MGIPIEAGLPVGWFAVLLQFYQRMIHKTLIFGLSSYGAMLKSVIEPDFLKN